jgi:hypothetical protein
MKNKNGFVGLNKMTLMVELIKEIKRRAIPRS